MVRRIGFFSKPAPKDRRLSGFAIAAGLKSLSGGGEEGRFEEKPKGPWPAVCGGRDFTFFSFGERNMFFFFKQTGFYGFSIFFCFSFFKRYFPRERLVFSSSRVAGSAFFGD